jgi:hypothetical protein
LFNHYEFWRTLAFNNFIRTKCLGFLLQKPWPIPFKFGVEGMDLPYFGFAELATNNRLLMRAHAGYTTWVFYKVLQLTFFITLNLLLLPQSSPKFLFIYFLLFSIEFSKDLTIFTTPNIWGF